jgi:hypothetical protein
MTPGDEKQSQEGVAKCGGIGSASSNMMCGNGPRLVVAETECIEKGHEKSKGARET